MAVEITIPSPGESITEVVIGPWHRQDGDWVEKDETLVEIESDKVTLEVPAPESGVLSTKADEGAEMNVGDVIGSIDPDAEKPADDSVAAKQETKKSAKQEAKAAENGGNGSTTATETTAAANEIATANASAQDRLRATSVARKLAEDKGVDLNGVTGTGPSGRITKSDVMAATTSPVVSTAGSVSQSASITATGDRGVRREKMSKLRQRIAERLVQAQHNAAMLTTFNECDMSAVMAMRAKFKDEFLEKLGVNLGFMSFFVKACVSALQKHPRVNAYIIDNEIEFHDFVDVSVAVGTEKGLVVPVIRDCQSLSFADIEAAIKDVAIRARDSKLTIDEMTGGTFTISNGGVYGSMNSTPILNPPQSGILGMHKIMKRAVEDPDTPGSIALRPMMYLALSYDHRIVDGAEAVGFLVHVKECIENPQRLLLGI